jgi:hypothetical protein
MNKTQYKLAYDGVVASGYDDVEVDEIEND